jgi:hypothetical protein
MPAIVPDSYKPISQNMANLSKALATRNAAFSQLSAAKGTTLDTADLLKQSVSNIPTFGSETDS